MIAVGVAEHPQADLLDLLDPATPLLLDLVTPLSHQAELEDPRRRAASPTLLIADTDPLVLEYLLHRHAKRMTLRLGEILDPPQTRLIAILILKEIESIGQCCH